ncbi:MAG TPA: hypothetical protein VMR33_19670 [Candidatus Baltobacteraceae bacterium]|jgi:hypothetical protein|nr:hypothetical protein [Candidatus Baltobacteraceae bacterium]
MTLAEAVKKLRWPILEGRVPTSKMLKEFVEMLQLEYDEWIRVPDNDLRNQQWAGYLTSKAKQQGWIRRCVKDGLLSKQWNNWPRHNVTFSQEEIDSRYQGKSVQTISAGAFEQNRRKH